MSGSYYSQVSIITCIYQVQSIMSMKEFGLFINYVSEHQLPPVTGVSYTTPTTHVNWGSKLLKLIRLETLSVF